MQALGFESECVSLLIIRAKSILGWFIGSDCPLTGDALNCGIRHTIGIFFSRSAACTAEQRNYYRGQNRKKKDWFHPTTVKDLDYQLQEEN